MNTSVCSREGGVLWHWSRGQLHPSAAASKAEAPLALRLGGGGWHGKAARPEGLDRQEQKLGAATLGSFLGCHGAALDWCRKSPIRFGKMCLHLGLLFEWERSTVLQFNQEMYMFIPFLPHLPSRVIWGAVSLPSPPPAFSCGAGWAKRHGWPKVTPEGYGPAPSKENASLEWQEVMQAPFPN